MSEQDARVSRRDFVLQTGLLAGGAALGTTAARGAIDESRRGGELPQRVLGKTGVSLTALTLGTAPSGFAKPPSPENVADCVNAALDLGVNSIDTAPAYNIAEEGVGRGLGKRRKDVFLATKVMADTVADAEASFSNSLRLLKTDCVDLVYFHNVGERDMEKAMEPEGVFTWLVKQKQAGKARFVGISGHNRPGRFARFLESGEVDVLLAVVNFADRFTYRFEQDVLPIARKHDVGIVAMKVYGGAKDMNYADPQCPPQLDVKHLELAVRYAMGIPGVATLNIGAHNVQQIRHNVQLVKRYQPLAEEELARCKALGRKLAAEWGPHFGPLVQARHPAGQLV
jgi:hypothetical protein